MAQLERSLPRREKGSHRHQKAKQKVVRFHLRGKNQRNDLVHKATMDLVGRFDLICIEDLNLKAMAKSKLSRSVPGEHQALVQP